MGLYYFIRAAQMKGHKFTDDVAVVYAMSRESAIKKFSELYRDVQTDEVHKIKFWTRTRVLTDY